MSNAPIRVNTTFTLVDGFGEKSAIPQKGDTLTFDWAGGSMLLYLTKEVGGCKVTYLLPLNSALSEIVSVDDFVISITRLIASITGLRLSKISEPGAPEPHTVCRLMYRLEAKGT